VVDWSYELLFEEERRLFARLSVFAGGCDLDAAEAICTDERLPREELLDLLSRLIDKSLVVSDVSDSSARYSELQILREYARERLTESNDAAAVRNRHAAWYRELAEAAREGLRGPDGVEWREKIVLELDNLRTALDWFIASNDAVSALSLATGIAWVWFTTADSAEGVRWLGDALALDDPRADRGLRGLAAVWHALHLANTAGSAQAIEGCREAISDLRHSESPVLLGEGLLVLSEILNRTEDFDAATASLTEARSLLSEANDQWGLAVHDLLMGANLAAVDNLDGARQTARAGVDRCRSLGERWVIVEGLTLLGTIEDAILDLDAAAAAYAELVDGAHSARIPNLEALGLMRLAALRGRQGDDVAAEQLFGQAVATSRHSTYTKAALIGRAAAAQRLGDLVACKRWLDEATNVPDTATRSAGSTTAFIGLGWYAPIPRPE
jgi:tetratricopeptide (TPR) repeat protein